MRSTRAFTLIELLVVIAIIAILAAILFPVFARAREKARQAACQSNLKQVVMALHMYADDHDETLCYATMGLGAQWMDEPYTWWGVTQPYLRNSKVLRCPSRRDITDGCGGFEWNATGGTWRGGLPWNGFGFHRQAPFTYHNWFISHSDVSEPASSVILADPGAGEHSVSGTAFSAVERPEELPTHHNGMGNYAFFDGHVKALKLGDIREGAPEMLLFDVYK